VYLSHFGLTEPPFRITPHTDFFFAGASRGATLDALLYAIAHDEGIVKVSGEVGSGKTMLCRVLMDRLPDSIETIYLANPSLSRQEILYAIADELKLGLGAERETRLLRQLQEHLISLFAAGRRVVVLIDEAHAMPKDTLEEIRLLSNLETGRHKLLQIVLFGQPELNEILGGLDMRQLKERITHSFILEPMVRDDVESYVDFRMRAAGYKGPKVFSAAAIRLISKASQGLTRRINILADKSLLAAFAGNTHGVTEKEARAAIRDSDFFVPQPNRQKYILAVTLCLGAIIGWGMHWLAGSPEIAAPVPGSPVQRNPTVAQKATIAGPASTKSASQVLPTENSPPRATTEAIPTPQSVAPQADTRTPQSPGQGLPTPEKTADLPVTLGKLTLARLLYTREWLEKAPPGHHSVQLLTTKVEDAKKIEYFLQRAAKVVNIDDLYIYSVKIDGHQHYRVAYGQFPSISELKAAIETLPQLLKSQNPYPRSIERMRSQNRQ